MAVSWRSVYSSHVSKVGYDPETEELHVQWDSGKVSAYSGVPSHLAELVQTSWSVGKALHEHIKPKFPHRYVKA